jgi:hypothetical protein
MATINGKERLTGWPGNYDPTRLRAANAVPPSHRQILFPVEAPVKRTAGDAGVLTLVGLALTNREKARPSLHRGR